MHQGLQKVTPGCPSKLPVYSSCRMCVRAVPHHHHIPVQAAVQSQANELAQLEGHSTHLKNALAALHAEEDHSLQKQRRLVAAAEEEVWLQCWIWQICMLIV